MIGGEREEERVMTAMAVMNARLLVRRVSFITVITVIVRIRKKETFNSSNVFFADSAYLLSIFLHVVLKAY